MKNRTVLCRINIVLLAVVMVTAVVKTADARYYDAALGRFLSADAVEGPNRYAYVNNNPVNMVDPSGNEAVSCDETGQCSGGPKHYDLKYNAWVDESVPVSSAEHVRRFLADGVVGMGGVVGGLEIPLSRSLGLAKSGKALAGSKGVQDIKHITEEVRSGEVNVVKSLVVKGELTSLAFIEYSSDYSNKIHHEAFFVPGNAKELKMDKIVKTRLSSLEYSMDLVSREAVVYGVETAPRVRRFGLAKSLFEFAFRDMEQHGINKVTLTWDGEMQGARKLYESLGFRSITPSIKGSSEPVHYTMGLDKANVPNLGSVKSWWPNKKGIGVTP